MRFNYLDSANGRGRESFTRELGQCFTEPRKVMQFSLPQRQFKTVQSLSMKPK